MFRSHLLGSTKPLKHTPEQLVNSIAEPRSIEHEFENPNKPKFPFLLLLTRNADKTLRICKAYFARPKEDDEIERSIQLPQHLATERYEKESSRSEREIYYVLF